MQDRNLAQLIGRSPNALRIMASRLHILKENTALRQNLELNEVEKQVVLGGLLGDLHCRISETSLYAHLQGAHCEKQKDYLLWKVSLLKRLRCRVRKTVINAYWYESKNFKTLNRYHSLFYDTGRKQVSRNILDMLNDFGLLIWYLDDGSYSKRDKDINLYTNGFSYSEQLIIK